MLLMGQKSLKSNRNHHFHAATSFAQKYAKSIVTPQFL